MGGHPGLKRENLNKVRGTAWREGSLACGEMLALIRNT